MRRIGLVFIFGLLSLQANDYYYEFGKKVDIIKKVGTRDRDSKIFYLNSLGKTVGVGDEIILKCTAQSSCLDTLKKYNFLNIEKLSNELFLVKIQPNQNIFTLSSELHNESTIEFAHPNFVKERTKR